MARYRLTESRLRRMIREAIQDALEEPFYPMDNSEEIDYRLDQHNLATQWTPAELQNRDMAMSKYLNGDVDPDYVGGAWDAIHTNENRLRKMIREDIKSIFSKNGNNGNQPTPSNVQNNTPQDHIYSSKELQWLYDNQDELNSIQQDVLRAAMWARAMYAGYHGYSKQWQCIAVKNGELYYYDKNNNMRKIGT